MSGIIAAFLGSFGDVARAKTMVDPDARFVGVRAQTYAELPLYGTFIGHDGLERFIGGLRAAFETELFVIDDELENDRIGFAAGRFEHRLHNDRTRLRGHWAVRCHFRQGRIVHYRFYEDTAALEDAFGVHTVTTEDVTHDDRQRSVPPERWHPA